MCGAFASEAGANDECHQRRPTCGKQTPNAGLPRECSAGRPKNFLFVTYWVWVKIKPGIGPQVLVLVSLTLFLTHSS